MKKVLSQTETSFREKGSEFLGYLFPAKEKEDFEDQLSTLKSKYPDATHHCYAWRMNPANLEEFAQDDGEPSGSAGLPILNQLKSFEVVNAGIVVVRYYGGTNLGKSGLIEAYGRSAEGCLQQASLQTIQLIQKMEITYPYSQQNTIEQLMHRFDLKELESNYMEAVTLLVGCPAKQSDSFVDALEKAAHLDIKHEVLEKSYL